MFYLDLFVDWFACLSHYVTERFTVAR